MKVDADSLPESARLRAAQPDAMHRKSASLQKLKKQLAAARRLFFQRKLGQPSKITLVLTEHCHLKCQFCRLWEDPRNGAALEEWSSFFAANPFLSWVNLTGGEVLATPDLEQLLEVMLGLLPRLAVLDFPTAGQRPERTAALVERLLASNLPKLCVTVSIDAGRKMHDELRGVAGSFDRAVQTYRKLRALQTSRFSVRVGCTLTRHAHAQVESLCRDLATELDGFSPRELHFNLAHHSAHYYRNQGFAELPATEALDRLERVTLRADPISLVEWYYSRMARKALRDGFPPMGCEAVRQTVFISPAMDVYPCSIWDRPLGNLREHDFSLERLLTDLPAVAARHEVEKKQCPGCFSPCEAIPAILAHPFRATVHSLFRTSG